MNFLSSQRPFFAERNKITIQVGKMKGYKGKSPSAQNNQPYKKPAEKTDSSEKEAAYSLLQRLKAVAQSTMFRQKKARASCMMNKTKDHARSRASNSTRDHALSSSSKDRGATSVCERRPCHLGNVKAPKFLLGKATNSSKSLRQPAPSVLSAHQDATVHRQRTAVQKRNNEVAIQEVKIRVKSNTIFLCFLE